MALPNFLNEKFFARLDCASNTLLKEPTNILLRMSALLLIITESSSSKTKYSSL